MDKYIPIIGLEIHVELKTNSKMFCGCPADWFGKPPNSQTCPVCLGMPGALPVPNKKAIEWTILIAKTLNCSINKTSKFDRKNYFYPDLPKGYQISQYGEPIGINGKIEVKKWKEEHEEAKTVRITRVHLEEDTGKLIHKDNETLVDFNRSGVPLVEIVTEPNFDNSEDVKRFLEELQTILRYLDVSDCDMEKGSMRLEPNISVKLKTEDGKQKTEKLPNYKVEVKNINSFRFVKEATEYEIKRQRELLEKGETPIQETRGYNEDKKITVSQRTKEEAHDYRYFPEPDIPPLVFDDAFLSAITVPELPVSRVRRWMRDYEIRSQDAFILTRDKKRSDETDFILSHKDDIPSQFVVNELINRTFHPAMSKQMKMEQIKKAHKLKADLKKHFNKAEIDQVIDNVIKDNPKPANDYKKGKTNVIMFLVGLVMREMKGQADASLVRQKIEEKLKN